MKHKHPSAAYRGRHGEGLVRGALRAMPQKPAAPARAVAKCLTCPRHLTAQEQAKKREQCEVCLGLRKGHSGEAIALVPRGAGKPEDGSTTSWWLNKDRKALNEEAQRRSTENKRKGIMITHMGFGDSYPGSF